MADELNNTDETVEEKPNKAAKKREKKEKKEKKKRERNEAEEFEKEDSIGSKLAVFLVTILILVVWLAIFALLIKADVGGFGSSVMKPLLKDVPYLNQILPEEESTDTELSSEDAKYKYDSMDDAVSYIRELEIELQKAQQQNNEDAETIEDLQAEIDKLKVYEENQESFEEEKEKFYQEVVFSDQAPDIEEYKEYYESIDSENAEKLYKQVVGETVKDEELKDYVAKYSSMKATEAAAIFDTMTGDLALVAKILENMEVDSAGDILGKMDPETAAKVTEIMEPQS